MLRHWRYSRLPLVLGTVGVTLATLAVWRYRRKESRSQPPATTPASFDDGGRSTQSAERRRSESPPALLAEYPTDSLPAISANTAGGNDSLTLPTSSANTPALPATTPSTNFSALPVLTASASALIGNSSANVGAPFPVTTQHPEQSFESFRQWARVEATEWQYSPVFLLPEDIQISDYILGPESPSYAIPSSIDDLTLPATTQSTTDVPTLSFGSSQISDYILGLENPSDATSSADISTFSAANQSTTNVPTLSFESSQISDHILGLENPSDAISSADIPTISTANQSTANVPTLSFESSQTSDHILEPESPSYATRSVDALTLLATTQSTADVSTSSFESSQMSDYILEPAGPSYATSNADVPTLFATTQSTANVSTSSFESSQVLEVAERHCVVQLDTNEPAQNIIIMFINKELTFELMEERYQRCRQRLDSFDVSRLEVKATIDPGNDWSLPSLELLGRAFARLNQDDHRHLCKTLNVKLPAGDEDSLESIGESIDLSLPNIESLTWESHRNQLPLIGLQNFTHLTRLDITSCLSMRDCELLLHRASGTLQFCQIRQVIEDNDTTHVFFEDLDSGSGEDSELVENIHANQESASPEHRIQMNSLEDLTIHSSFRSDLMLNRFDMKGLRFLDLQVKFDQLDFEKYMKHLPWSQLDGVRLDYEYLRKDVTWVKERVRNEDIYNFIHTM
ncbi:hypothetical protein H2248_010694 [Termitomyces sp. 'cryptogamus']|nr:hypothetical protein H2248_010694 [Termitomyces sp. 'cryptogamus']